MDIKPLQNLKICTRCRNQKPFDFFGFDKKGKHSLHAWCKSCKNAAQKQHIIDNRDTVNARVRSRRVNNPIPFLQAKYKCLFGISYNQFQEMIEKQHNLCAICDRPESTVDKRTGKIRKLAVDHNHITKKVRELLCGKCNQALGLLNEDLKVIINLIKYIQKHKEK